MNISQEEEGNYLADIKQAVSVDRYRISAREKNRELYMEYVFNEELCKRILLDLNVEDFSDAVRNKHSQYAEEILYIFGKEVKLLSRFRDVEERVSLYIKFNKLEDLYLIVVSFHKQQYPLNYKFK